MKTCKDCLHYEICKVFNHNIPDEYCPIEQQCDGFDDLSEWVHLPRKVEDLYSLKAVFKKCVKNKYAIVRYDCRKNKPYKIVSYNIRGKELLKNEDLLLYDFVPSMNFTVIANGFNSQEEAEKALKRMKENDRKRSC